MVYSDSRAARCGISTREVEHCGLGRARSAQHSINAIAASV
jgi:hypothetical protein